MTKGEPVARESVSPCQHNPGPCCGRRWHQPHVPLKLLRILLWVNPTTPSAFLQRGSLQELTKAFPNVLVGLEHPDIRVSGFPGPEPCPCMEHIQGGTTLSAHVSWSPHPISPLQTLPSLIHPEVR